MIKIATFAGIVRRTFPAQKRRAALRTALLVAAPMALANADEGDFFSMMTAAMDRMHSNMTVAKDGNPDRVFAAAMIPHHEGAIDMARAELVHGRDPRMRRLAQGIVIEQQQEISMMRAFLRGAGETSPPQGGAR